MNKIYLGKHDYKLKDCIFATTCKRYFGKKCDKICDEFAAKYISYINEGGLLSTLLEIGMAFEKEIIDSTTEACNSKHTFNFIFSIMEHCIAYANKYDDDDVFLFYLNNIEKLAQYYDIEYSGKLFLHNHNSNSVFGFQLYDE